MNVVGKLVALLVCSFPLVYQSPVAAETIRIRADEWLPYNGPSSQKPPGYMIEMASAIAKTAGHTIDYRHIPWDDALEGVRAGRFDCVVGATRTDAPDFSFPDQHWGLSSVAFYALAESTWRYNGVASLEGIRLGVIPDYSYSDELDPYIEAHGDDPTRVIKVTSGGRVAMSAASRLVSGKMDVFVEDPNVMRQTLRSLELDQRIVERGRAKEDDPIFIACTPADPRGARYAKLFSEGTNALRASGELDAILARYGMQDWQKPEGGG